MKQIGNQKEWQEFINDGCKYLKTAVNGSKHRQNIFTPEIIYNIVAMSIEKNIMGYLLYNNRLPDNHTLRDLVNAVRLIHPFENVLFEKLNNMDRFQEICSIDLYNRKIPNKNDVQEFLNIGIEVQSFVAGQLTTTN